MSARKTDNFNLESKLELRRYYLRKYHADSRPYVLECCQGSGVIWNALSQEFSFDLWGVDMKPKKGRLKIDSVRILQQPGWPQDVIDIDTYGSPWKHWFAMLPNIARALTVFLTIGHVRMGGIDPLILESLGLASINVPSGIAIKMHDMALPYLLAAAPRHGVKIIEATEATRGKNARYIGLRLEPASITSLSDRG